MKANQIVPWVGPAGVSIPPAAKAAPEIVPFANGLREGERRRVVDALEQGFFDMGAEFVWRRAMGRLRQTVSALGMDFVGEMLGRRDLSPASNPEAVLTDVDTIRLAEQLGVIGSTGAMKLRHAFEVLSHYAQPNIEEELPFPEALVILRTCVQFALGEKDIQVAVDFSKFRDSLVTKTLNANAPELEQLAGAPPFFLSTATRALLAAIKTEKAARLQHSLNNLNTLLPTIWAGLPEQDRWSVGSAYADAVTSGRGDVIAEMKRALLKVSGFDYVPESLRSNTYIKAAQAVIEAHYGFGNFEGEIKPTQYLAGLGTVIPKPAVPETIRALLLVVLGNRYGHSWAAATYARPQLKSIPPTVWDYYLSKVLPGDDDVLDTLVADLPAQEFATLVKELQLPKEIETLPKLVRQVIQAAMKGKPAEISEGAQKLKLESRAGKP